MQPSNDSPRAESRGFNYAFSPDELKAIEWFRGQYWDGNTPAEIPDHAIAFMLLRVALGHPAQLAGWIDQLLHYREAEGVSMSEFIDRKIAAAPEYRPGSQPACQEKDPLEGL